MYNTYPIPTAASRTAPCLRVSDGLVYTVATGKSHSVPQTDRLSIL